MRFRTLEIRWHDSKPISTCDFQPVAFKKARPSAGQEKNFASQSYRLATGGEDNHVRIWMVYPNIRPSTLVESESTPGVPRPPRVEYLATLSRHSAAVNVVRFSPNGELIASAGDDGMIIIWAPSASPQVSTYGSDLSPEDLQHEKEYWKPRTSFRCTTMQVYDLAWSPSGEYILAGSTDNTARVFSADGKCVYEMAEHNHYVQGVAWDPLHEYFATQSSDRSMHVYRISTKPGMFEAHAIGKNTRLPYRHSRTPSTNSSSRPTMFRSKSATSDAESSVGEYLKDRDDQLPSSTSASGSGNQSQYKDSTPLTPATSAASTSSASMWPPPPIDKPSSRRSSFSGSNAPSSPSTFSRYGRSPSPMPPLPAIRTPAASWTSVKLYGDENYTNFFRRLTFSPDGALLLTPAGQFEDPSVLPGLSKSASNGTKPEESGTPARGRRNRPSVSTTDLFTPSTSSVYIYSRANFARPPIAQLPGHKKASVAVRFSPILYELRQDVIGANAAPEPKTAVLEKGTDGFVEVDVVGPVSASEAGVTSALFSAPQRTSSSSTSHVHSHSQPFIAAPAPRVAGSASEYSIMTSPAISPADLRPPTPAASKPSTPTPNSYASGSATGSVFALPYRMLYAVVTMDTVAIYDTQQAGPICMLTKLHYDEFTDVTWSPDGQCLMLSSRDGYCSLIIFDEILPAHHTQQHTLQLQSIAHHHSVPMSYSTSNSSTASASHHNVSATGTPIATPSSVNTSLPFVITPTLPKKRGEPPLTPAASVDGDLSSISGFSFPFPPSSKGSQSESGGDEEAEKQKEGEGEKIQEPPKKKRRVTLTRVGDLDS